MKKLAQKLGSAVFIIAIIPACAIIGEILKLLNVSTSVVVMIILPLLAVQLFSLFLLIKYPDETL